MFARILQYSALLCVLSGCASDEESSDDMPTLPSNDIPTVKIDPVQMRYSNLALSLNAEVGNIKHHAFAYEWQQVDNSGANAAFNSSKSANSVNVTLPNVVRSTQLSFSYNVTYNDELVASDRVSFMLMPNPKISDLNAMDGDSLQLCLDAYVHSRGWQFMSEVTELVCGYRNLTTLVGLEQFLELKLFSDQDGGALSDEDLFILSQLPSLETLEIQLREINNLPLVANYDAPFPSLKKLDLLEAKLTDLEWTVSFPTLETLLVDGNSINDFSPLVNLPKLKELWLGGYSVANQIDFNDYDVINSLNSLTKLQLYYIKNTDINKISELVNITELGLNGTDVTDISSLSQLEKLTSLKLMFVDENFKSNDLNTFTHLTELDVYDSDIALTDILDIPLNTLRMSKMNLSSLAELNKMKSLQSLNVSENNLTDISPLSSLTNLVILDISRNSIDNIASLSSMANLEELNLNGIQVNELSPLYELRNLKMLSVSSMDNLTCEAVDELKVHVPTVVVKGIGGCS